MCLLAGDSRMSTRYSVDIDLSHYPGADKKIVTIMTAMYEYIGRSYEGGWATFSPAGASILPGGVGPSTPEDARLRSHSGVILRMMLAEGKVPSVTLLDAIKKLHSIALTEFKITGRLLSIVEGAYTRRQNFVYVNYANALLWAPPVKLGHKKTEPDIPEFAAPICECWILAV